MDKSLDLALTKLGKGALLRVADARGRGIAVFGGSVWITQHEDRRDIFVEGGESFTFDRPGLAIVQALQPTRLLVYETYLPQPSATPP